MTLFIVFGMHVRIAAATAADDQTTITAHIAAMMMLFNLCIVVFWSGFISLRLMPWPCSMLSVEFGSWRIGLFETLILIIALAICSYCCILLTVGRLRLLYNVGDLLGSILVVVSLCVVLSWSSYRERELPIAVGGFGSMLIVLAWVAGRLWHERTVRKALTRHPAP